MSGYPYILLTRGPKEHIATLTLNRPDRCNALNDLRQDEIGDAIEEVEADRSIRVMVFTGSGRMKMAATAETITLTSADHAEGTAAFPESRTPIFEDK